MTCIVLAGTGCSLLSISSSLTTTAKDTQTTSLTVTSSSGTDQSTNSTSTTVPTDLFSVSFDSLGGDPVQTIDVEKGTTIELPIPSREGYSFLGWYTGTGVNDAQFTVLSVVTRDLVLYAKWEINQYSITFYNPEGDLLDANTVNFGSIINFPSVNKIGHVFEGWYTSQSYEQKFTNLTMPASNLLLYPKFTPNKYTVTFYGDDLFTVLLQQDVEYGNAATYNGLVPTKESTDEYDYIFVGWNTSLNAISGNLDVYAVFSPIETNEHFALRVSTFIEEQINEIENTSFSILSVFDDITLAFQSTSSEYVQITTSDEENSVRVSVTRPYIPDGGTDLTVVITATYTFRNEIQTVSTSFIIQAEPEYNENQSILALYSNSTYGDYISIDATINYVFSESFIAIDSMGENFYVSRNNQDLSGITIGMNVTIKGFFSSDDNIDVPGIILLDSYQPLENTITVPSVIKSKPSYDDLIDATLSSSFAFGAVYYMGGYSNGQDVTSVSFEETPNGDFIIHCGSSVFSLSGDMTVGSRNYLLKYISSDFLLPFIFTGYLSDGTPQFMFDYSLRTPYYGFSFIDIATSQEYFQTNNITLPAGISNGFYIVSQASNSTFSGFLNPFDILLAINGTNIIDTADFVSKIPWTLRIGTFISATVYRNGETFVIFNILVVGRDS